MNGSIQPKLGQWVFRLATIFAAPVIDLLLELQRQVDGRQAIDWHPLISSLIAAAVIGLLHIGRAGTEKAESNAEIVTGTDQDADKRVETPEP